MIVADNSHYFMTQELLGAEGAIGGVEVGTFMLSANEDNITNAAPVINTNNGDTATNGYMTYNLSDDTATFTELQSGNSVVAHRVAATATYPEAGAWIAWEDDTHFTTIAMNGTKYMFSSVNLTTDNYNLNQDGGRDNATEFGSYTLGSDGAFTAVPDAATDFSAVCTDTNPSGCDTPAGDSNGIYGFNGVSNVSAVFPDNDHMTVTFTENGSGTPTNVTFTRIRENGPDAMYTPATAAFTQADLTGTWQQGGIFTPVNATAGDAAGFAVERILKTYEENGSVLFTFEDNTQETYSAAIDPVTGQLSMNGTPVYSFINAQKNFVASVNADNATQIIQPSVKRASSYLQSDLTGTWIYTELYTPNSTPDADLNASDLFWIDNVELQVQSDGNTTFTERYSSLNENLIENHLLTVDASSGQITFDGTPMPVYMNAGKDVVISGISGTDRVANDPYGTDENSVGIWVKKASSYSQSDLTGTWNTVGIWTPRFAQPQIAWDFGYDIIKLVIDENGNAAQTFVATSGSGLGTTDYYTATMAGDGTVSVNGAPIHAFMNADKTVMVIFEDDIAGTTQSITIAVKQN